MNVGNIGLNLYVSSMVSAAVELPAYGIAVYTIGVPRAGRRGTTVGGLALGGGACLLTGVSMGNDGPGPAVLTVLFFGKFALSMAFAVVYMWAAELFPTSVRSRSVAMQSMCARVGGMLAP